MTAKDLKVFISAFLLNHCRFNGFYYVFLFLLLVTACGKKANQIKEKKNNEIINQEPLDIIQINLSKKANLPATTASKFFSFNALIKIPENIYINKGSTKGLNIKIYFNAKDNKYDFYCNYVGEQKSETVSHALLDACFDSADNNLGFGAYYEYPMDKNKAIVMQIANSVSDEDIFASTDISFVNLSY